MTVWKINKEQLLGKSRIVQDKKMENESVLRDCTSYCSINGTAVYRGKDGNFYVKK